MTARDDARTLGPDRTAALVRAVWLAFCRSEPAEPFDAAARRLAEPEPEPVRPIWPERVSGLFDPQTGKCVGVVQGEPRSSAWLVLPARLVPEVVFAPIRDAARVSAQGGGAR